MQVQPLPPSSPDHLTTLRRLTAGRWLVLLLTLPLILLTPQLLDIPLPSTPLLAILAIAALFNAAMGWRLRHAQQATAGELLSQILGDIAILSALIFFSGGAANPLISLLLPPVAIAALTLPPAGAITVGMGAIGAYSLLMAIYVPLPLMDPSRATRLHLIGMWLTFAFSAAIIGWFVARMTAAIRLRDAALAEAREQALRHERILALGTLAAGAAHELSTPLATMAVIAGELSHDKSLSPMAQDDIATLRQQVTLCKEIITSLARRSGNDRLESASPQALDRWLEGLRQRWQALRPAAESRLSLAGKPPTPDLLAHPTLEQAVINLLNNAANASGKTVAIEANWDDSRLTIDIRDQGPGFPDNILALGGSQPLPPHAAGSGIGLMLTRTAVEQSGGTLELRNLPGGGAQARISLPTLAK